MLITLEGVDGTGKETYGRRLAKELGGVYVSNPYYDSPTGAWIRDWLEGRSTLTIYEAARLFAVNRYQRYVDFWRSYYRAGTPVILDRYVESNIYYTTPGLPAEERPAFREHVFRYEYDTLGLPRPETRIFLSMDPALVGRTLSGRAGKTGGETGDRYENDIPYLRKVNEAGRRLFSDLSAAIVLCCTNGILRPMDEIYRDIREAV